MGQGHVPCKWLKPKKQIGRLVIMGRMSPAGLVGKINDQSWGLNPFATLYAGHIASTTIGQQAIVSNLELANLLRRLLDGAGLNVVNVSIFYQKESISAAGPGGSSSLPRGDPVLDVIRADGNDTLFVVAAGNDGEDFTAICDMRPACLDLPNVISVAALDGGAAGAALYTPADSGGGSNYGRRVHVAAPGANILGLINGNYLGLLSGTSQADSSSGSNRRAPPQLKTTCPSRGHQGTTYHLFTTRTDASKRQRRGREALSSAVELIRPALLCPKGRVCCSSRRGKELSASKI